MIAVRLVGCTAVCAAAGAIGYVVGKARSVEEGVRVEEGPVPELVPGLASQSQELVEPRAFTELPPSVAAALESALAGMAGDPVAALVSLRALEDDAERAEAIFELVGRLDAAQLGALVTGFASAEEGSVEAELLGEMFRSPFAPIAMFDRWAKLDPDAVIAFARSPIEKRGGAEMPLLMRALSIAFIAGSDPDTAFGIADQLRRDPALQGSDSGAETGTMIEAVIGIGIAVSDPVASLRKMRERGVPVEAMVDIDPIFEFVGAHGEGMLAEIMQFPDGEGRAELLEALYGSWGSYDLDSALASIEALPEGAERSGLLDIALSGAAERDPAEAARRLDLLPEGEGRRQVAEGIVQQWSGREPVQALRWARQNLGEMEFITQLQQASEHLPAAEGRALVEGLSEEARAKYFRDTRFSDPNHYVMRMVREDPAGAMDWLDQHGGLDSLVGSVVGEVVSAAGIDSAIEFAANLPEAEWRDEYLTGVAREAGRTGDPELLAWAQSQGQATHSAAINSWALEYPQAAAEYAATVGQEPLNRAVGTWAEDNPAAAYRWTVEAQAGDPEFVAEVISSGGLLESWSRHDPAAAAQAMEGFPSDLAGDYVGRVIESWAQSEPGRASEFVAEHFSEEGAVRDAAVSALVEQIRGRNPGEARAWAESISNEDSRATLLESLQP